ncbi:hypothetical protein [Sporomusa acidovorans]|uniref:Uncharacterized protein n=1 Tax=Sporomusa acidovorans (strain ATCC 49682 / DSM 3132 / Mol) TaxID=1123286 RepID=A0ABZ3JA14_SPOA4|nr:hypothetical protein [Sporomusa acidovorans]OZC21666.1 hypothetical protein SPACI_17400 [Sporomusa acidovorans DSM 3132]SDD60649.1 hypothetical protein SAMN04488499_1002198 [Sporomusa acidovorans]
MAGKRRPYWEEPEIDDWDDDEEDWEEESGARSDRQVLPFVIGLGLGLGFGCRPRRYCYPRDCYPRYYCYPRSYCYPRYYCYPRPCYPL